MEFRDYIYFEWLFKKVALLHGNCHMEVIKDFLMSSEQFSNIYAVYPNPPICCNAKGRVEKEVLKNCDLWIHQEIRTDNEYGYLLSDEYMRSNIKADTIEIVIPNLFGLGKFLFIQTDWNKRSRAIANGKDKDGMFPQAGKVIDMCAENGMDKNQILHFCLSGGCFDEGEIKENFKACMEKIRKREKSWDAKISDFINMNYRNKNYFMI